MRLHRLRMQNFRQHAKTEIVLNSGITSIIGPNGSGKTTILEAIAWALYGNQAIRGNRDSIRFTGAGPRAQVEVELDFELAGHRYRVTRGLTTAAVYLDGSEHPIANSITGVAELLQRRLGMTRSEFFSTYFTGQKELSVMANMGPTERAQFLSRVLGYERLRLAQDLVREHRRMIGAEITGLRSGMADAGTVEQAVADAERQLAEAVLSSNEAGARHAAALAELQEVTPRWEQIQKEREKVQNIAGQLAVLGSESKSVLVRTEQIDRELKQIGPAGDEVKKLEISVAPLVELSSEIKVLDELYREQGRRKTLVDNLKVLEEEIAILQERYGRLETAPRLEEEATVVLEEKRRELEVIEKRLDLSRTAWVRDKQEAETKLVELRRQYAEVKAQREQIESVGADGICPTCNKKLGDTFNTVVEQLSDQLSTLQVDGQYYRNRGEQLSATPRDIVEDEEQRKAVASEVAVLEKRLTKIQLAVQELPQVFRELKAKQQRLNETSADIRTLPSTYDAARHSFVRAEIDRLTPLTSRLIQLRTSLERLPLLEEEREALSRQLLEMEERSLSLKTEKDSNAFSEQQYSNVRLAFEQATALSRTTELAVVSAQAEVRSSQRVLDDAHLARKEFARVAEALKILKDDRIIHDELDRTYADLRTDLNLLLRPELSDLASSFLGELTDDRYTHLELDDQYNILILEDGRSKPVISGGEEDLANLVLRLAISQMIAERAGQAFSLLILDEVFGSLDIDRRGNVVELLRRVQDRFEQVILITHIDSIRDGVDQVIEVRHDTETGASIVTPLYEGTEAASLQSYDADLLYGAA